MHNEHDDRGGRRRDPWRQGGGEGVEDQPFHGDPFSRIIRSSTKPYDPHFAPGQTLAFKLRANPTITRAGNHQAWVTSSRDEIEPQVATAAAKLLARRYGGDPGAANWQQPGRLPGFTNRKEVYCKDGFYPWTGLARPVRRIVPPGAAMLIAEARELAASTPASSSSTLGACDHHATDVRASDMTPDEAKAIYDQTCAELMDRFNWTMPIQDRSRADYAIARNLALHGFDLASISEIIHNGSEKAAEGGFKYAARTATSAIGLSSAARER